MNVDFFDGAYANFSEQVMESIREATFGEDIGQNSWVTADEYEGYIETLQLNAGSHVLEVASGSGGPAMHLVRKTRCRVTGVDVNASGVAVANAMATRDNTHRMADAIGLSLGASRGGCSSSRLHR